MNCVRVCTRYLMVYFASYILDIAVGSKLQHAGVEPERVRERRRQSQRQSRLQAAAYARKPIEMRQHAAGGIVA